MYAGQIKYCTNKLDSKSGYRPCIILSVDECLVKVLYITKNQDKWDFDKIEIEDCDTVNFKNMPSFVVLGIFDVGCMECSDTKFSAYITDRLKQKLKSYGFDI
jgi:hypothetical protein